MYGLMISMQTCDDEDVKYVVMVKTHEISKQLHYSSRLGDLGVA